MRRKRKLEPDEPSKPLAPTVNVRDWDFVDVHSDAGRTGIAWTCPDCLETVTWANAAWWRLECKCRTWDINISITGELKQRA